MSEHKISVIWERGEKPFTYQTYSRLHEWRANKALVIEASAAPDFFGDAEALDPEQALVGSLSSCHMLTFLAIAAKKRLVVDCYQDRAVGYLEKSQAGGPLWISRVELRPAVVFSAETAIDTDALRDLHHKAHQACFIAQSVKTAVNIIPTDPSLYDQTNKS